MSLRGLCRWGLGLVWLVGALSLGASCYRAEVDLAPLLDDALATAGGGMLTGGAGETASIGGGVGVGGAVDGGAAGAGGEGGAAGAAGAPSTPECDATPEEPIQSQCRLRTPSKQVCDEQALPGWAGCYNGGCSICTEVLVDYPYYLSRHPCCGPNITCSVHAPRKCSPLCPPPTELDKKPLCFNLEL